MSIASRKELIRAALRAATPSSFNPARVRWNEVQQRTNTSAENPFGDEWPGEFMSLDKALRTMQAGEVMHVCVYSRPVPNRWGTDDSELLDVVMVQL